MVKGIFLKYIRRMKRLRSLSVFRTYIYASLSKKFPWVDAPLSFIVYHLQTHSTFHPRAASFSEILIILVFDFISGSWQKCISFSVIWPSFSFIPTNHVQVFGRSCHNIIVMSGKIMVSLCSADQQVVLKLTRWLQKRKRTSWFVILWDQTCFIADLGWS